MSTKYEGRVIFPSRSVECMQAIWETMWFYNYGNPKQFSADPEFCNPFLTRYSEVICIERQERSWRFLHKNGVAERNNGIFKALLAHLKQNNSTLSPAMILARASFPTNVFMGSSIWRVFQFTRGHSPSILGVPASVVVQDLINAHTEKRAARAIQGALRSKPASTVSTETFHKGVRVWFYYDRSKLDDRKCWSNVRVVSVHDYVVKSRRRKEGLSTAISYEHIRVAPWKKLLRNLTNLSAEELIKEEQNTKSDKKSSDESSESDLHSILGSDDNYIEVEELSSIGGRTAPTATSCFCDHWVVESHLSEMKLLNMKDSTKL